LKIAILIFGEYRTFESTVNSWNCRFWDNHQVDYYMSTWDYSYEPLERFRYIVDLQDEKWANESYIREKLPNVKLKIHGSATDEYIKKHDTNRMVFHWKTLYEMVSSSNIEYDCIFMIRTDSMFYIKPEFFTSTKRNTLYTENILENHAADIFFFGWGDVILKFLKNYPDKVDDPHSELFDYLQNNYEYDYCGIHQEDGMSVDGWYYRLIRSNMAHHFDYLNESHQDLLSAEPYMLSQEFTEELRYSESMYHPGPARVLLIGETCKDIFVYGNSDRVSPEAPALVFNPSYEVITDGMAGNVYNQLEAFMTVPDFITTETPIIKKRYVDESSNYILFRVDDGDAEVKRFDLTKLPNCDFDFIIFSDYDKGFLESSDIEYIVQYYKEKIDGLVEEGYHKRKLTTFMDTKKMLGDWAKNIDYIKLNYKEYLKNKEFVDSNKWMAKKLIITRGKHGCDYNGRTYSTNEVNIKDVSGAGDTFLASLVCKYQVTREIVSSIEFANEVGELVVQKKGVATIEPGEVMESRRIKNKINS
jgi:hypothetical protein